eukprot:1108568-Rhodomonas_salina.2
MLYCKAPVQFAPEMREIAFDFAVCGTKCIRPQAQYNCGGKRLIPQRVQYTLPYQIRARLVPACAMLLPKGR